MRDALRITAAAFALALPPAASSCGGGPAGVRQSPPYGPADPPVRQSLLVPGPGIDDRRPVEIEVNAAVLAEGRRLYNWYNCAGCHFSGGGGIGPPLMDDDWIYGSEPRNIAATILEGRPNGMPSYGGKIPAEHVAPVVAYVRSLSGLGPTEKPTPLPSPREEAVQREGGDAGRQQTGPEAR